MAVLGLVASSHRHSSTSQTEGLVLDNLISPTGEAGEVSAKQLFPLLSYHNWLVNQTFSHTLI